MHGAEFYASKRHKGEHFDGCNSDSKAENSHRQPSSNHKRMNPPLASQASAKLMLDSPAGAAANHQVAITSSRSPPRNHVSAPVTPSSNNIAACSKIEPDCLPISDNNVSTTNDALLEEHEWDNDADINVSRR